MPSSCYIGRFAPSPSGPLHMGSLVCAVASFLDAKSQHGKWLLRIEDIDPPREQLGASDAIINSLQHHGLLWDDAIIFQSKRSASYHNALDFISQKNLSYFCTCTRKRLSTLNGVYDGHCRFKNNDSNTPASVRLNLQNAASYLDNKLHQDAIEDNIQGLIADDLNNTGDFIIHRKDGLFAYQLAVIVDDIDQKVTHIVRGTDLIDCTHKQNFLLQLLKKAPQASPQTFTYSHIPVLSLTTGLKLSKQNHAPAIDNSKAKDNLLLSLTYLQQSPPSQLKEKSIEEIIQWGTENWNTKNIPAKKSITV